jgi:hypothetical protein
MDIRDEIITGSFAIGQDGRKEPIDWKNYALKLETKIEEMRINSATVDLRNLSEGNAVYVGSIPNIDPSLCKTSYSGPMKFNL